MFLRFTINIFLSIFDGNVMNIKEFIAVIVSITISCIIARITVKLLKIEIYENISFIINIFVIISLMIFFMFIYNKFIK